MVTHGYRFALATCSLLLGMSPTPAATQGPEHQSLIRRTDSLIAALHQAFPELDVLARPEFNPRAIRLGPMRGWGHWAQAWESWSHLVRNEPPDPVPALVEARREAMDRLRRTRNTVLDDFEEERSRLARAGTARARSTLERLAAAEAQVMGVFVVFDSVGDLEARRQADQLAEEAARPVDLEGTWSRLPERPVPARGAARRPGYVSSEVEALYDAENPKPDPFTHRALMFRGRDGVTYVAGRDRQSRRFAVVPIAFDRVLAEYGRAGLRPCGELTRSAIAAHEAAVSQYGEIEEMEPGALLGHVAELGLCWGGLRERLTAEQREYVGRTGRAVHERIQGLDAGYRFVTTNYAYSPPSYAAVEAAFAPELDSLVAARRR